MIYRWGEESGRNISFLLPYIKQTDDILLFLFFHYGYVCTQYFNNFNNSMTVNNSITSIEGLRL